MIRRLWLLLLCLLLLCGCGQEQGNTETTQPELQEQSTWEVEVDGCIRASEDKVYEFTDSSPVFSLEGSFYTQDILVELRTWEEAEIYYTLDGSEPNETSRRYTQEGIRLNRQRGDFPNARTIKARAYYPDGSVSGVSARTYFCCKDVDQRFSTLVFSVSGEPEELVKGPDGIFYGENYNQRGRESEREVYLEAWTADGQRLLSQYCGVRVYGGASRAGSIKSMKLYARKSYSSGDGKFDLDVFGTLVQDDSGLLVDEYDKMVLRNGGNDFQFAYIRDELCQILAKDAGFTDYEMVVPAVCYLNGEYYGLFWLHESYCDDYFKNKYPNKEAKGEFVVIEGNEQYKNTDPDDGKEVYAEDYNKLYEVFSKAELTDDAVYAQLCEFIDIENYLDYFAFNSYIGNWDWPRNNYKCYRFCPVGGENFTGVYDGRWRYLLHDTDYSLGLYEQQITRADYNGVAELTDPESDRYAPLFVNLMTRADCRDYFFGKLIELSEGALSEENMLRRLDEMLASRAQEQAYLYKHMENKRKQGWQDLWSRPEHWDGYVELIREFIRVREHYIMTYAQGVMKSFE